MTLTESCIAAAVVSTVMAVSLPSIHRARQSYALRSAAYEVVSGMQLARISAISRSRDCRLVVTSSESYVIECDEGPWRTLQRFTTPEGIAIEANARPEFHRRGNVSPTATVTVRNAAGEVRKVIVNVNGRIRIQ